MNVVCVNGTETPSKGVHGGKQHTLSTVAALRSDSMHSVLTEAAGMVLPVPADRPDDWDEGVDEARESSGSIAAAHVPTRSRLFLSQERSMT